MKVFLLTLISAIYSFTAIGQRGCATSNYWQNQLMNDAALRIRYQELQKTETQQAIVPKRIWENNVTDIPVITIPVVVHVLYNTPDQNISTAQIASQLTILNNDFSRRNKDVAQIPLAFAPFSDDCRIQFELAKSDPDGRATTGILRKKTNRTTWKQDDQMKFSISDGSDAWDSRSYLNIWVCNLDKSLLGYSTFPGASPEKDGVVIRTDVFGISENNHSPYNKGRSTTHEVGHWLNLKHLWGDTDCGDDGVADTPPQKTFNSGCPSFPKVNYSGCNPDPAGDMFMNFMDFSDDACLHMFTTGQKERMHQLFSKSGARESLLHSNGLKAPFQNGEPAESPNESAVQLTVFPNPATDAITINFKHHKLQPGNLYTIHENNGRQVATGLYTGNPVSVKALAAGMYFIRVSVGEQTMLAKFVKH